MTRGGRGDYIWGKSSAGNLGTARHPETANSIRHNLHDPNIRKRHIIFCTPVEQMNFIGDVMRQVSK